jgi:hypothetical protein
MAIPAPQVSGPMVTIRDGSQRLVWILWIAVSILGAVLGALVAWQIRSLVPQGPAVLGQDVGYVATVVYALIASGAQWLLLRHYRLDVDWWVPATVTADLIAAIAVIPTVLGLFVSVAGPISPTTAMVSGAAALAAAGLVVGVGQALVLRRSVGNIAWAWIPATMAGGALAGALTTALTSQLLGLPYVATLSLATAAGALLTAASQAPILLRAPH